MPSRYTCLNPGSCDCGRADSGEFCRHWGEHPAASPRRVRLPAVTTLRDHLTTESLGGGHPLMVVVPRDALEAVLAEADELREYQEQQEELMRRV